jgi:hypothetical protein
VQYSVAAGLVSDCTFQPAIGYVVKELDKEGPYDMKKCEELKLTPEHFADLRVWILLFSQLYAVG